MKYLQCLNGHCHVPALDMDFRYYIVWIQPSVAKRGTALTPSNWSRYHSTFDYEVAGRPLEVDFKDKVEHIYLVPKPSNPIAFETLAEYIVKHALTKFEEEQAGFKEECNMSIKTRQIVINTCHGGFGLTPDAIRQYIIRKGVVFQETINTFSNHVSFATVQPVHPKAVKVCKDQYKYHKLIPEYYLFNQYLIPRDDPDLVAVVKELGFSADGPTAELKIVEIPADVKWRIDEYDGRETIREISRSWK